MSVTDPAQEYFKDGLWGWDSVAEAWVKLAVNASGNLIVGPDMPDVSGAPFITTEADSVLSAEVILGTSIIMSGTAAAKPAASLAGRIYFETDTLRLFRDTGAVWTEVSVKEADELKATGITDNWVLTADGADECAFEVIPTQGFFDAYVCVLEQQNSGVNNGTFTQDAWQTRPMNTEQADSQAIASVASNQITLDTGTYICKITCPARNVSSHKARLYDTTATAVLLTGTSEFNNWGNDANSLSIVAGQFTLSEQSVLEVQHYCDTTRTTDGFGSEGGLGTEVYGIAEFWRLQ